MGGATGPGLSGGQKRRLCVALQLINMPSFIFLDEPTSGENDQLLLICSIIFERPVEGHNCKSYICTYSYLVVLFLRYHNVYTIGLDATSSLELLSHLHRVASSNRAVVLTIHQPRLEIFHMFDKVILLCQGQVKILCQCL